MFRLYYYIFHGFLNLLLRLCILILNSFSNFTIIFTLFWVNKYPEYYFIWVYYSSSPYAFWIFYPLISVTSLPCACAELLQLCLALRNPMNCSPPDSSVHGILQGSILECAAMPSSRGSSQLRNTGLIFYVFYIGRLVLHH